MAVNNVPKADVGAVVQDFIDNDETVVVARKVAEDNYTVGPGADVDEGEGTPTEPKPRKPRSRRRRKPS
jgi:hypothetical protein